MSIQIIQGGILSLLQDTGRIGKHRIGLTTGGPMDPQAFSWCNRLLQNEADSSAIEVSFGGLQVEVNDDTYICATGAPMPLTINNKDKDLWCVHRVYAGDTVALGFSPVGVRTYLGVANGFSVSPSFGSTATVMREHLGGLRGDKLVAGDKLPCSAGLARRLLYLAQENQPAYDDSITVRVVLGYQQQYFSRLQHRRFFGNTYQVSDRCDRMGYRLEGPEISCDIEGILSEGICYGAIQIPADGQPIALLYDRQTIGGYPKIGSALSIDAARLAQLKPGGCVQFAAISTHAAHNALHLMRRYEQRTPVLERPSENHS
jgi:biotin-dependent carboxylase-like uncharacterized protein